MITTKKSGFLSQTFSFILLFCVNGNNNFAREIIGIREFNFLFQSGFIPTGNLEQSSLKSIGIIIRNYGYFFGVESSFQVVNPFLRKFIFNAVKIEFVDIV